VRAHQYLRLIIDDAPHWRDFADCATSDADLWFAEKGDADTITHAKAVCAGCPVREQCLDYALTNRETHGIWGGMSYKERLRYRKASEAVAS
jgi:WhiB family redox-sensing transcriptional regulator